MRKERVLAQLISHRNNSSSKWRHIVLILSVLATVISIVWLLVAGGFEPAIASLVGIAGVISSFIPARQSYQVVNGDRDSREHSIAMPSRSEIERALDDLVSFEEGSKFQSLAVILAKKRWQELIASERKWDLGLDAYAPASGGEKAKGVACSITASLGKIKSDLRRIQQKESALGMLIFCTSQKVTRHTATKWAEEITDEFGLQLVVVSREDYITSLMDPANAALCRNHLGLRIAESTEAEDKRHLILQACREEAQKWLPRSSSQDKPLIYLRLSVENAGANNTRKPADLEFVKEELLLGKRFILEAPPGAGKTTTLAQLAGLICSEDRLCLVVDLPRWAISEDDIFDFVVCARSFKATSVTSADLARATRSQHVDFLLNGWNEVGHSILESASQKLRALDREFPSAGIVIATRTHSVSPPLFAASSIQIHPLGRELRFKYLKQALGERGAQLSTLIGKDRVLDDLTRTPLILHEVVRLFESDQHIPNTKLGILLSVTERIEDSVEHRVQLEAGPLSGQSGSYL